MKTIAVIAIVVLRRQWSSGSNAIDTRLEDQRHEPHERFDDSSQKIAGVPQENADG